MKTKPTGKILSLLLAACMALTLLPAAALADLVGDITIDMVNFPDEKFREWLLDGANISGVGEDGTLTADEIAGVTFIDVSSVNISSLAGIEYFTALKTLYCSDNQLTTLDVSKNTALKELSCYSNQLATLDVNTALEELNCSDNQLTTLDVSENTALTSLDCSGNQLSSLDVSNNTALIDLWCAYNRLTKLDLTGLSKLSAFWGMAQDVALTLTGSDDSYTVTVPMHADTVIGSGLTYGGGVLTSDNKTLTTVTFTAPTGLDEKDLSGTLTLTYEEVGATNAETPVITGQPAGATYAQGASAAVLSVTATVTDGGTLSYQWYSNGSNSTSGGTAVGTNSATYTPSTAAVGTTYYYCVVTNTNTDVSGIQTATATSDAAAVTVQAAAIVNIAGLDVTAIENAITAALADNTSVTVTGSKTGVVSTLSLAIPEGQTVVWQATYTTATALANGLIQLTGPGAFEVAAGGELSSNYSAITATNASAKVTVSGGTVSATMGYAIIGFTVTVSGTAKVEMTGNIGTAIWAKGNVTVKDSATVSATMGKAIDSSGTSSIVTVSGTAKVEATGYGGTAIWAAGNVTVEGSATVSATTGRAIYTGDGANSTVTVSGGMVSATTGNAILTEGASSAVTVSGGTVSATTGYAIYTTGATSAVTVSGTAKVGATGNGGYAILAAGNVTVEGSATVSATTGRAIYAYGATVVTVSGGTVSATTGYAIYTTGATSAVTVSGTAKVGATGNGGYAILAAGNVTVKGSATVSATTGAAIYAYGATVVTVSGGTVSATTGYAIFADSTSPTVKVSGGVVFAHQSAPIYMASSPTVSGNGVVIGWNASKNVRTYPLRGTGDLTVEPEGAAYWYNSSEGAGGVAYKSGDNEGFIPVAGVTVEKTTLTKDDFTFTIPTNTYNGSPQGIGTVTLESPHDTSFNATTGGTFTVFYEGTGGTVYTKSQAAPTNAGAYAVTVEIGGGTEYAAASISLGSYTIAKADPTVTWPTADAITYGAALSASVLTPASNEYGTFAWANGALVPNAGSMGYPVTFTPIDTGNYDWSGATLIQNVSVAVSKAAAPVIPTQTVSRYRGEASTGNMVDLAALLPADHGGAAYHITSSNMLVTGATVNASGMLSFATSVADSVTSENITIEVTMVNYNSATITVTVNFVDKKVPVVTETVSGSISYGQPLSTLTISASALVDGTVNVPGSIAWDTPLEKPYVGTPGQGWTFTPVDTAHYETVKGFAAITVNKATPSGTPTFTRLTQAGKTLADANLTVSFTNPYSASAVAGNLAWDRGDGTAVMANTAYSWTFTPDDTANYTIRTGSFTPYTVSGGGYTPPAENTGTVYNNPSQPSATVWLSGSGFSAGDLLVTETLTRGSDYNALIQLADKGDILRVYDISFKSDKRQDGGAMHLTFALGTGYAGQSFTLVHKKADGTFEYFFATANASGQVKFGPLYELSPFMLVKGTLLYLPTDQILNVPKTGDKSDALPFMFLALAALCVTGAVVYRKKRT